jgi:hypothetical protein
MSGRRLLKSLAAKHGLGVEEIAEQVVRGDLEVAGEDGVALRKAATRQTKLKKWIARASARGHSWDALSKRDRKVFRAAWRADRALAKLQQIEAQSEASSGAQLAKAAGSGSERLPEAEIRARTAARMQKHL